ncbi:MAG: T9SS type A sorting domain-containing protein [Bacteroidales bacterium]|nr:T9SS type A sorting domain-containing protein [Bacteroidales bacterium]
MKKTVAFILICSLVFISCSKEKINPPSGEIIFKVPIYKEGKMEYSDLTVFPNPFLNELYVYSSLPEGTSAEVQFSDGNGDFSWKMTVTSGFYKYETQDLPKGVYYVEVKRDSYVDRAKLLKLDD